MAEWSLWQEKGRKEDWWRQYTQEQDGLRSLSSSMAQQEAWEPPIMQKRIPGVGLED